MRIARIIRDLSEKELLIMYNNMKWTRESCECGADYNVCRGCILTNKLVELMEAEQE